MTTEQIQSYAIEELRPSPFNPRKLPYPQAELAELAESIKSQGVMQPIVIRTLADSQQDITLRFEIVFGHRRYFAAQQAGLYEVPCVLREMDDRQAAIAQAHENAKRQDVTAFEEADSFARLRDEFALSVEQVAEAVGRTKAVVYARLKMQNASPAVRDAHLTQKLAADIVLELARIPHHKLQDQKLRQLHQGNGDWVGVRGAREIIRKESMVLISKAPFDLKDEKLHVTAGACSNCPKLAANDPDLVDLPAATCIDTTCYSEKLYNHQTNVIAFLRADGHTVLEGEAADKFQACSWITPAGHDSLTTSYVFDGIAHKVSDLLARRPADHPPLKVTYVHEEGEELRGFVKSKDLEELTVALGLRPKRAEGSQLGDQPKHADPMEGWTEAERLVADQDVIYEARTALIKRMLAVPRSIDEMRAMALRELDFGGDFGLAGKVLGFEEPLPEGVEPEKDEDGDPVHDHLERYWVSKATADQLGALFAGMAVDDILISSIRPSLPKAREYAREKLELLGKYGIDIIAFRPAAAEPAVTPSKAARAQEKAAAKPDPVQTELAGLAVDEEAGGPEFKPNPNSAAFQPAWPFNTGAAAASPTPSTAARAPGGVLAKANAIKRATARYLNAATGETWSGKGLQPAWLKAAIKGGAKLDDFDTTKAQSQAGSAGSETKGAGAAGDASSTTPAAAGAKRDEVEA